MYLRIEEVGKDAMIKWTNVNGFIVEVNNLKRRELHVEHNKGPERKSRVRGAGGGGGAAGW